MRGSRGAARHFRTRSALAAPARSPTDDCRIPNRLDPNEDVGTSRRSMEGKQSMEQSPVEADPATAATSPRTGGCRYGCPIPDGGQGAERGQPLSISVQSEQAQEHGPIRERPGHVHGDNPVPSPTTGPAGPDRRRPARRDPDPRGDFGGRDEERPYRRFHHRSTTRGNATSQG